MRNFYYELELNPSHHVVKTAYDHLFKTASFARGVKICSSSFMTVNAAIEALNADVRKTVEQLTSVEKTIIFDQEQLMNPLHFADDTIAVEGIEPTVAELLDDELEMWDTETLVSYNFSDSDTEEPVFRFLLRFWDDEFTENLVTDPRSFYSPASLSSMVH